jgi:hypothetical protein
VDSTNAIIATVVAVGVLSTLFLVAAFLAAYISWRQNAGQAGAMSGDSAAGVSGDNPLFKPLIGASNPLYNDA